MMENSWTKTDRIFYGIMCSGMMLWAIAMFIEACRSRPKVQVIMLGVSGKGSNNGEKAKAESSSAAE